MKAVVSSLALSAVLLLPALASAQKVNVDFDPAVNFAGFKTYAWMEGTPSPNPLGEQRIHDGVDQRLAAEGFTKATPETANVMIATHVISKERKELTTTGFGGGYGYGYSPWMGGGMATSTVQTYTEGTLIVDMFDTSTKKLVWRGMGTDTMSDEAEKNAKKVYKALDKMFKKYPPVVKDKK